MKLKGNLILAAALICMSFIVQSSARANPVREARRGSNSLHRASKGKRAWNPEPLVSNSNPEVEVKLTDEAFLGQLQSNAAESTGAGSNSDSSSQDFAPGKDYLRLEGIPPNKVSVRLHSDVTLRCQAAGSPPPMIYWLKNGIPIDSALPYTSEEISNHVDRQGSVSHFGEKKGFVMSTVKSKLVIQCIRPEDEGQYSCVADNDAQQVIARSEVVIEEDDPSEEIRPECEYKLPMFYSKKARKGTPAYVVTAESIHMELIGNDVVLPCRAGGRPRPKISWVDNHGQPIVSGKRFQVNSNGNLLIRNLRWKDMGEFSCEVENPFGNDSASTFVYPLMTEEP